MSNFKKCLLYYRMHIYTKEMLHRLVDSEYITKDEYKKIIGEEYQA